jgi:WD40 repeat protein/tetratricopeptide (TPR) repeat protein
VPPARAESYQDRPNFREPDQWNAKGPGVLKLWDLQTGKATVSVGRQKRAPLGAFSPDGRQLTTVDADRTVTVWDVGSGQAVRRLPLGHGAAELFFLAFSPDVRLLVSDNNRDQVIVWDLAAGQVLHTLARHTAGVRCAAFSPDGRYVATGGFDATITIWDLVSGREVFTLRGHLKVICALAFSPDGQVLASASDDGTAKIWDARNAPGSYTLWERATDIAFCPNGQALAARTHGVRVLDVETGRLRYPVPTGNSGWPSRGVVFSADGRFGAAPSENGAVVWDAETGREIVRVNLAADPLAPVFNNVFNGQPVQTRKNKHVACLAFSPDGKALATGSWVGLGGGKTAGEIVAWDLATGRPVFQLQGHTGSVLSLAYSPDGRRLATGGNDNLVKIWDTAARRELLTLHGHNFSVNCVAYSPDGRRLISGSGYDGTIHVWDAGTGQRLRTFRNQRGVGERVVFSPDGQRLASAGSHWVNRQGNLQVLHGLTVWDLRTGEELLALGDPGDTQLGGLRDAAFSPDGRRLALSGKRGVRVWETPDLADPITVNVEDFVHGVAFSADGRLLAVGTLNGAVKIYDTGTGQERLTLKKPTSGNGVARLAFSGDGRRLVTAAGRDLLQLWDLRTGTEVRRFRAVGFVALNGDGSRLACAVWDGRVLLWDAVRGEQVAAFAGFGNATRRLGFSADGRRLVAVSVRAETRVWDLQTLQPVPGPPPAADLPGSPNLSPDRRRGARWDKQRVLIEDLQAPSAAELARRRARTAPDPGWHEAEANWQDEAAYGRQTERHVQAVVWHLGRLLTERPDEPSLHLQRARALAELGRWAEARADFAVAAQAGPDNQEAWQGLALTDLADGQVDAYRTTCAELLRRCGRPRDLLQAGVPFSAGPPNALAGLAVPAVSASWQWPQSAYQDQMVRVCLLDRDTVADPAALLRLARANEIRGAVLCRAGRHAQAAELLTGRKGPVYPSADWALGQLFLALARQAQGRTAEAQRCLKEAVEWMDARRPSQPGVASGPPKSNADALPWDQRLTLRLLRREAEAALAARANK